MQSLASTPVSATQFLKIRREKKNYNGAGASRIWNFFENTRWAYGEFEMDSPILEKPTRRRFLGSAAGSAACCLRPISRWLGFRESGKWKRGGKCWEGNWGRCASYRARAWPHVRGTWGFWSVDPRLTNMGPFGWRPHLRKKCIILNSYII